MQKRSILPAIYLSCFVAAMGCNRTQVQSTSNSSEVEQVPAQHVSDEQDASTKSNVDEQDVSKENNNDKSKDTNF